MLPLTHSSQAIRASVLSQPVPLDSLLYLAVFGMVSFVFAVRLVRLSQN